MASLVIGAIGAGIGWGIGGTFLGMSAMSLGWNIGSTIGSLVFAPKTPTQYGPRLSDLKVQASTYGNPLPIVYGTARLAGNMIWSMPIKETRHKSSSGGKGGKKSKTVTFTYSQTFAVALCEGPIAGVRKIWANGELIYNVSTTATAATVVASNKTSAGIIIYLGSETQVANSLIEANIGAADTPAYRGLAYVVFNDLQLAKFGNRTPNLEFEIINDGTPGLTAATSSAARLYDPVSSLNAVYMLNAGSTNGSFNNGSLINGILYQNSVYHEGDGVFRVDTLCDAVGVITPSPEARTVDLGFTPATAPLKTICGWAPADKCCNILRFYGVSPVINQCFFMDFDAGTSLEILGLPTGGYANVGMAKYGNYLYLKIYAAGVYKFWYVSLTTGVGVATELIASATASAIFTADADGWYICDNVSTRSYTHATATVTQTIAQTVGTPYGFQRVADGFIVQDGTTVYRIADAGTKTNIGTVANSAAKLYSAYMPGAWVSLTRSAVYGDYISNWYGLAIADASSSVLSGAVSDICTRTGLTAGQIDVTTLSDTLHGYTVTRSTARAQLEQLMAAFYFDAVESDGKVKFVKRGASPTITIAEDDLAAHVYGSDPPDTLTTTRAQEMELPVEMEIQYMDRAAGYAIGTQRSQRLTTESENKSSINFAIAMTASKAKQIADVLMYDAWTARTTFDFLTGWKYSYLEPTDVIQVTKDGRTHIVRLTGDDYDGMISRRSAVLEDISVYTQTGTAADLLTPDDAVSDAPLSKLILMDIPLLRDQDDGDGFYAAACGYGTGWSGAQIYRSTDGGATWGEYGDGMLNAATIGAASDVLGDFTQNIFDESNSVTVVLTEGDLASETEINVLNGANVALLGDEIIQFRDATLIGATTYTLTGLLRGRLGTEWARSTHVAGERFVLFSTSTTYLLTATSAEYDLERKYRAVTFDGWLDDAPIITFTNTAVAQTPLSPVHLGGGRDASGNITLTWIRRTRIGGAWNSYADVPLGETSEAYEVDIYTDGTYASVARTITGISNATTSYTSAQQTTDFGSPQSTIYCGVSQVSALVGRGYETQGAI